MERRTIVDLDKEKALAAETMTTYEMANGDDIYGEYRFVCELEYLEGSDEPTDIIKKVWRLESEEAITVTPAGWPEPEDGDAAVLEGENDGG